MLIQIIYSMLFILPLFGSMNVLFSAIKSEMNKKNIKDSRASSIKIIGFFILSTIGLYISVFLIWLIWIPNFDLPFAVKMISYCIAAPYLLGVIGVGFAMKKVTEFGGSTSAIVNTLSDAVTKE